MGLLEEIVEGLAHELGTVLAGLSLCFIFSGFLGYFLRGHVSQAWFRPVVLLVGGGLSGAAFFLFIDELELEFVLQLFIFFFVWGVIVGFEQRRVSPKKIFSLNFWFPEKFIQSVFSRR